MALYSFYHCIVDRPCEPTSQNNIQPQRFVYKLILPIIVRALTAVMLGKPESTAFSGLWRKSRCRSVYLGLGFFVSLDFNDKLISFTVDSPAHRCCVTCALVQPMLCELCFSCGIELATELWLLIHFSQLHWWFKGHCRVNQGPIHRHS